MDTPETQCDFGEPLPGRQNDLRTPSSVSREFLERFWERQLRRLKEYVEERANRQQRTIP